MTLSFGPRRPLAVKAICPQPVRSRSTWSIWSTWQPLNQPRACDRQQLDSSCREHDEPTDAGASAGFAAQKDASDEEVYGGALTYANVDLITKAHIDGRADATNATIITAETIIDPLVTIVPGIELAIPFTAVAVAGSVSGGDTAVAGAVAINDFDLITQAYVGSGAKLNRDNPDPWSIHFIPNPSPTRLFKASPSARPIAQTLLRWPVAWCRYRRHR